MSSEALKSSADAAFSSAIATTKAAEGKPSLWQRFRGQKSQGVEAPPPPLDLGAVAADTGRLLTDLENRMGEGKFARIRRFGAEVKEKTKGLLNLGEKTKLFFETPLGKAVLNSEGEGRVLGTVMVLKDAIKNNWQEVAIGVGVGAVTKYGVKAAAIASGLETYLLTTAIVGGAATAVVKEGRKIYKEQDASLEKRQKLKALMHNKARLSKAALYGGAKAGVGYYVGHEIAPSLIEHGKEYGEAAISHLKNMVAEHFSSAEAPVPIAATLTASSPEPTLVPTQASPTEAPSSTPTATLTPTEKPLPTSTSTALPTVTSAPVIIEPTATATVEPTATLEPTASPIPSPTETVTPTMTPTPISVPPPSLDEAQDNLLGPAQPADLSAASTPDVPASVQADVEPVVAPVIAAPDVPPSLPDPVIAPPPLVENHGAGMTYPPAATSHDLPNSDAAEVSAPVSSDIDVQQPVEVEAPADAPIPVVETPEEVSVRPPSLPDDVPEVYSKIKDIYTLPKGSGEGPWAASRNLILRANPNLTEKDITDTDIMKVDAALCRANNIMFKEAGIMVGRDPASLSGDLEVNDDVKEAIVGVLESKEGSE